MIDVNARIHDRFSVEFKTGYVVDRKLCENDFVMNTWIFIPYSLDINSNTYSKVHFYRDVKSYVRLITPIYTLEEVANSAMLPYMFLQGAFHELAIDPSKENMAEYEYQIKMFISITKSALRQKGEEIVRLGNPQEREEAIGSFIENIEKITGLYRNLLPLIQQPEVPEKAFTYFSFGDEFLSNRIEHMCYKIVKRSDSHDVSISPGHLAQLKKRLIGLVKKERAYKESKGYAVIRKNSPDKNQALIFRLKLLKKYVENHLFLNANRKKDGQLAKQVYFSIAAGISMTFATAIAFSFQQKYGNFTMPLFVALVASYMLKDRIKDLFRFYFAHRLTSKYYDNKTIVSIKDIPVGKIKEGIDFIPEKKVPGEIIKLRNRSDVLESDNRNTEEKIILYRKSVNIDGLTLDANNQYDISGINDIVRFNFSHFILKMDEPELALAVPTENDDYEIISGGRIYYINFLIQLQYGKYTDYRRIRLTLSRNGINGIEKF